MPAACAVDLKWLRVRTRGWWTMPWRCSARMWCIGPIRSSARHELRGPPQSYSGVIRHVFELQVPFSNYLPRGFNFQPSNGRDLDLVSHRGRFDAKGLR